MKKKWREESIFVWPDYLENGGKIYPLSMLKENFVNVTVDWIIFIDSNSYFDQFVGCLIYNKVILFDELCKWAKRSIFMHQ